LVKVVNLEPNGIPPSFDDEARELPHSTEAEQSVLGAIWHDNRNLALLSDLLASESFYHHEHKLIFDATASVISAGLPADPLTVADRLRDLGLLEPAGGIKYINEVWISALSGANVRRYGEIVAEKFAARSLIAACGEALQASWQTGNKLEDRLERVGALFARAEKLRLGVSGRVPMLGLDQLRTAFEQVRWTVKHVIPANSIGMLFGGSGTFKSFIALDAGLHLVHGLPWMGRSTQRAPVLYIAAEGGAGLWSRINAWHKARGLKWGAVPFYVVPAAVNLAEDAWRVVDAAQALGVSPGMVIIDTLSQTYAGEENSANEMAAYLRELGLRFRDLWQCSVVLVHHTGHQATERPRGSSAIRSNVDFLLSVFRDEKEMLATMSCVKQKDGELFRDATFSMSVVDVGLDNDGDKITSLVARHLSTAEEVENARINEQQSGRGGRNSAFMGLIFNGMNERDLRKAFYDLLEGLDAEAKKKAYFRARAAAVDSGRIEVVEGTVIMHGAGR
jgi:hypothetical protein